jgi:type II secretory pathway pseudopilin PulG
MVSLPSPPPAPRRRRAEAGYNLVVLVMLMAVLTIMLSAALPKWSEMIKRDKEEELISRGFQYAEAIRVFQRRFQRYPVKLDELLKAKPRSIRQLWKDPMTANGDWQPIFAGQGSPINVPGAPAASPNPPGNGLDPNQPQVTNGPIVGVRSRSTAKSLLLFFGHEHYDEWEFRVEMLSRAGRPSIGGLQGIGDPGAGLPGSNFMQLSTRWLGRPMPDFTPPGGPRPPSGPIPVGGVLGGGSGGAGSGGSGSSGGSGGIGRP